MAFTPIEVPMTVSASTEAVQTNLRSGIPYVANGITDPVTKSTGDVLQYNGSAWVASDDVTRLKEDIENISGISDDVKLALLNLAQKVSYIDDDDGAEVYQTLYDALYPPSELVSISAVYTQSGTIYDTDTLDDLKPDLVVTATYEDSSTAVVTSYVLSGTLTTGTSTITVSYGGKTTTFTVTVTHDDTADWDYIWEYTDGLPDVADWTWSAGGGSGQIHTIVDDGMKVTAKSGTYGQYAMDQSGIDIGNANGGVVEFRFYIPSEWQNTSINNANYGKFYCGDGTNGFHVDFQHIKSGGGDKVLRDGSTDAVLASPIVFGTEYKLKFELNASTKKANIYLNDTIVLNDYDYSASTTASRVAMAAGGGSVSIDGSTVGIGFIISSIRIKYGL